MKMNFVLIIVFEMHYYYFHYPFYYNNHLYSPVFFSLSITLTSSDIDESCIADLDRDIAEVSFTCLIGLGS